MKYLIASDIHGAYEEAKFIYDTFVVGNFDKLILLGDILYHGPRNDLPIDYNPKKVIALFNEISSNIIAIKGNCEAYVDQMVLNFKILDEHFIDIANRTYYLCHGHLLKFDESDALKNNIILYGHYHIPSIKKTSKNVYINVGSIALPKENSPKTYAVLDEQGITIYSIDNDVVLTY